MIIDLLAMPGVGPPDFASLRTVVGGATAVDPALILDMEAKPGVTVIGAYGQSEGPAMIASSLEDSVDVRMRTLGRCLAGRDFCTRDRSGAIVRVDAEGELCVRGPLTMSGYLRPDGSIDPAVDAGGWRGTGDLCTMTADGVITFKGRIREVVIRGGLKRPGASSCWRLSGGGAGSGCNIGCMDWVRTTDGPSPRRRICSP